MKANAVFEGGGMRAIGIVGALRYFEKKGYQWHKAAGTSAGAIIAALTVAGYTPREMEKIIVTTDFTIFQDKGKIESIPVIGKAIGVFKEKGIYSGERFEQWLEILLKVKGIEKFKDVSDKGQSRLKIIAVDITQKRPLVMPDDLSDYGIDPMEFSVVKAVRMSISIPFYFKPVKFEYSDGMSYIVDGGICYNYPIGIFDTDKSNEYPTIGFKFKNTRLSYTAEGRRDTMAFLFDIAGAMSNEANQLRLSDKDLERSVIIPTLGVDLTDFNLTKEKSIQLFKAGYKGGREFLDR